MKKKKNQKKGHMYGLNHSWIFLDRLKPPNWFIYHCQVRKCRVLPNVPIIEIADEPEPAQPDTSEADEESSTSGDSEQENREMYEALDNLNMLPLNDATPLLVVLPEVAGTSQTQK